MQCHLGQTVQKMNVVTLNSAYQDKSNDSGWLQ